MKWLSREACGWHIPFWIGAVLLFEFLFYMPAAHAVIKLFHVAVLPVPCEPYTILSLSFPFLLFRDAFKEEILFRLPIAGMIEMHWKIPLVIFSALSVQILFGWLHAKSLPHVFLQGVGGICYSLLFLKCGGLSRNYLKATLTTAITHFLYNGILALIALSYGATTF
jgi:hypothetical protein